jgi:hypothetical protein
MLIGFETKQLRQLCESENRLLKELGMPAGKTVMARLADFRAAQNLQEVINLRLLQIKNYGENGTLVLKDSAVEFSVKSTSPSYTGISSMVVKDVTSIKLLSLEKLDA